MPARKKTTKKKATKKVIKKKAPARRKKTTRKKTTKKKRRSSRSRWGSRQAREAAENGKTIAKLKAMLAEHQRMTTKIVADRNKAEVKIQARLLTAMKKAYA